jgi:hypothetical protein
MPDDITRDILVCTRTFLQVRVHNHVTEFPYMILCITILHMSQDQRRPCRVGHNSMRILEAEGDMQSRILPRHGKT